MEYKVNQLEDSIQELEVNLTYEEILPDIEKAYEEERKNITIDGFRKGKAPISLIKKFYGEAIEHEASEKIANKKFWEIIEKENIQPISVPILTDINYVKGDKLFFKIKYEITPKIELKNYKNLEIEKPIFKVNDEEVEKEIEFLLNSNASFEEAESVENNNYRITVNLQRVDESGLPIIGQRTENIVIDLKDERVNQQIVENAIGKKVGEKFPFHFVDEHHHGEELHREEYHYEAEIIKIEKKVIPEPNEEIIKKITNNKASNLEEWKNLIRKNITEYYNEQSEDIFTNNLLNEVVKNNDFNPPPSFVESLHKRFVEYEKENAKRLRQRIDEQIVSEYYKPKAEWNAKWQIILENIAKAENITVDDSDLEKLAKEESEKIGISVEKLVKYYKDTNKIYTLLENKVINFLKENTKIKEVDAEEYLKEKRENKNET
ncbi:trigger factor [Rosettibacter firmus]|uniref:trigger factor n=1 Tax=Rosettibacter firmus TaxID=3111522 RepID=UPI00336BDAF8